MSAAVTPAPPSAGTISRCQGCGTPIQQSRGRGRARKWCSERCRKAQYSTPCVDCGRPTYGGDGQGAHLRCVTCSWQYQRENNTIWTREAILVAIRAWANEHGGIPPSATDWNPTQARAHGHPKKATKFYRDDAWPHSSNVVVRYGSWNAAIQAAGYQPRPPGKYGREGEDSGLCQELRRRYEAGTSTLELAREHDCTPDTIAARVRRAGGQLRSYQQARQLQLARERNGGA